MLKPGKKRLYILITAFVLLMSNSAFAQKATVRVTIEPSEILIGEQAIVNVEVIAPKDRIIQFPVYEDTIVTGIEVLAMLPTDTLMTEVMKLNQRYLVTSFDSTLYHVSFIPILDGNDTLRSNDFGLKVSSPQLSDSTLAYLERLKKNETDSIDFQKLEIKEPYVENVIDPPFVWKDYIHLLWIALAVLLVIAILTTVIILYIKKRKKGYYFTPKIIIPPHILAIGELKKLKEKHLCQQGLEKEYYTQVSDIIRTYINGRYPINATEMISDDIINAVNQTTDIKSATENLAQILQLSDMVKFAKYIPLPNENDLTLANALKFVNDTRPVEELKTDESKVNSLTATTPESNTENKESKDNNVNSKNI